MRLLAAHIKLIEEVNGSLTNEEHDEALARLQGFRRALDAMGINQLIECDEYYLSQGIDRPMCCGVWLDWRPK